MNLKTVKDLIDLVKDTDIVELEWTPERIHLKRGSVSAPAPAVIEREVVCKPEIVKDKPTVTVTSPLVGTFYRSSSSDSEPFVKVGATVAKGQVLCIIEAMKLMNEIEAHVDGTVTAILKQDGEKVGYGDHLFIIEEA